MALDGTPTGALDDMGTSPDDTGVSTVALVDVGTTTVALDDMGTLTVGNLKATSIKNEALVMCTKYNDHIILISKTYSCIYLRTFLLRFLSGRC